MAEVVKSQSAITVCSLIIRIALRSPLRSAVHLKSYARAEQHSGTQNVKPLNEDIRSCRQFSNVISLKCAEVVFYSQQAHARHRTEG